MIDARELRIGNWVYILSNIQITRGSDIDYAATGADPIPLTPEILEKVGFKNLNGRGKTGCYRMGDVKINIDNISIAYIKTPNGRFMELVRFNYLHQLQNIFFSLCGKELEIKL